MQLLVWCLRLVLVPLWLAGVVVYGFCACHSVTLGGRAGLTGLALICTAALLLPCFCLPLRRHSLRRRLGFVGLAVAGLLLLAPLFLRSPSGKGGDSGMLAEHVYTTAEARPSRLAVSWVVPEVDQIAMGVGLARWVDAYLDQPRAARLRALSLQLYQQLDRDPALSQLGSMLGAAYGEAYGGAPVGGHYLAMVPRSATRDQRVPLVVFIHGSAGNFSSYWKVLAPLVRSGQVAVICPTFGFGNWYRPGGVQHLLASIRHARRRYAQIGPRTYLVGLSNGGTGVTGAVARCRRCFSGVAYVSGVFQRHLLRASAARGAWRGQRVLVIHGQQDLRIPPQAVRSAQKLIKQGGARISRLDYPREDHFLFFARRKQVVQRIASWIGGPVQRSRSD